MEWDRRFGGHDLKGRSQATALRNPTLFAGAGVQEILQVIVGAVGVLGNNLDELDTAVIKTTYEGDRQLLHAAPATR